ncbi:MAG: hypothetical protein SPJ27_07915 [Candidatus Onthovivens sp.]|nr:hypothetical protein [Candidatus Onthovivens sp.]
MSKYEAVEKVAVDTVDSVVNVDDFVKKVIDINYARSIEFITKINKIFIEEIEDAGEINISLKDLSKLEKYKYIGIPIYVNLIKSAGKLNIELVREIVEKLVDQLLDDYKEEYLEIIKSTDDINGYISTYLRKIEKIERIKSNLSAILDFTMDIVQGKMVSSMMKPIINSLIDAYNKNDPFAFISIEEYYGVNENSIRKLIKFLKVIAE